MPVLRNPRHEAFAQNVAKGMPREEAYIEAGYKPDRHNAFRLTTVDNIASRISELRDRSAQKAEWTAADRLLGLKAIYDACATSDRRTAISAVAEANKMQGSYAPAKREISGPNGGAIQTIDLSNVSADDLERLEAIFGRLAGSSGDDAEDDTAGED